MIGRREREGQNHELSGVLEMIVVTKSWDVLQMENRGCRDQVCVAPEVNFTEQTEYHLESIQLKLFRFSPIGGKKIISIGFVFFFLIFKETADLCHHGNAMKNN